MEIVQFSSKKFMLLCAGLAVVLFAIGLRTPFSSMVLGAEVLLTILSLFVFGSAKYQIHKNALTYGALLVIGATFATNPIARASFHFSDFLSFHGLDEMIHADTMLFILGLTFFVSVIAQTHILQRISFAILRKMKGNVLSTVLLVTGLVAFCSGILDGVSMIGLMIRTLVIILLLAKVEQDGMIFAVIVSTVITTVCGMWLAYGEPPNLIMKANLHPLLTDGFFLRYCLPAAVASYLVVVFNVRRWLKGKQVNLVQLDEHDKKHEHLNQERSRIQLRTGLGFIPFIGLLIAHGINHKIPLCLASLTAFVVAYLGLAGHPEMKRLAVDEAKHEYAEYYFLFPLFLSITLLQKSGFFNVLIDLLHQGIENLGVFVVAYVQYAAACVLSALLDNNIVADFASRALQGLDVGVLHLFSMAQIAGYAAGGCWTHIGSAQSVVAFAFICREIKPHFSPFRWIKMMTPVILQISLVMAALIYAESLLIKVLS